MKSPLVHGCFEHATLSTLLELGIDRFGFDLRATSSNLITFTELKSLVSKYRFQEIVLTFQNDKMATVLAFVDLLKNEAPKVLLEFRDQQSVTYYHSLNLPFLWMFHPKAQWKDMLSLPQIKGILLPLEWKEDYQALSELWSIIEDRKLDVFVHARTFQEAEALEGLINLNLSVDLTVEVEKSFRLVDQDGLRKRTLWRKLNENPSL